MTSNSSLSVALTDVLVTVRTNADHVAAVAVCILLALHGLNFGLRVDLAQVQPSATQVRLHAGLPGPAQVEEVEEREEAENHIPQSGGGAAVGLRDT